MWLLTATLFVGFGLGFWTCRQVYDLPAIEREYDTVRRELDIRRKEDKNERYN